MPTPWKLKSAEDALISQLIDTIVGFTIPFDQIEGKAKLNQNHSTKRKQKVVDGLQQRKWSGDMEIAGLMQSRLYKTSIQPTKSR